MSLAATYVGACTSGETTGVNDRYNLASLAQAVRAASDRISPHVVRTPTVRLPWLDIAGKREVWAKLECWQLTGSFKARGAFNALTCLPESDTCVTASAGNHGLALAAAACKLGQRAEVFVPTTASELKVRRIIAAGARVTIVGRDLAEATDHAMEYSHRRGVPFISPFANWDVAAGQGTCINESIEDAGAFDTVLVALGGGGLFTGAAAALAASMPSSRLVAIHPAIFGRRFTTGPVLDSMGTATPPTYADGLAVQHTTPNAVAAVLQETLHEVWTVTEDEILLGIYALLHGQSLLVEGAGAAPAAALLTQKPPAALGRTLLVLSGGNVSAATVAKAAVVNVEDSHTRIALGLRRHLPALDQVAPVIDQRQDLPSTLQKSNLVDVIDHEWDQHALRLGDVSERTHEHRRLLASLDLDRGELTDRIHRRLHEFASGLVSDLQAGGDDTISPSDREDALRLLLRLRELLTNGLEWASPAYDQSLRINFFEPSAQAAASVNYARYGTSGLRELELELLSMLGFTDTSVELLATSSGMAAYQLLECLLLRRILIPGDTVVRAPYIYFEASEQLASLRFLHHVIASSYDVEALIETVEHHDAKVLFVDPMSNIAGLPTVDFVRLAALTADRPGWAQRWLVVDGTMVSGGLDVPGLFREQGHPGILYYESASKYAQFGLDLQMAGICLVPKAIAPEARRARRNTGAILYPEAIARFPRASRAAFLARMRLMSANAQLMADKLRAYPRIRDDIIIGWADDWARRGWAHGGAVLTVEFRQRGLNNRDGLDALIQGCLESARTQHVPLVKGLSFGFTTTRISAASAMAENSDPFLRFSMGANDPSETARLACLTADAIAGYLARFGAAVPPHNRMATTDRTISAIQSLEI